jgi:hypothetical protein
MKWLVEAIVDLCFPPVYGEMLVSFGCKLVVFILLVLMVVLAFLLSY